MMSHNDEMNEIKLLQRKNKGIKHLIAQAKIDETGDIDAGKTMLKKLDNLEDKQGSGIPVRKIGGCRKPVTKSTRPKTEWQLLVSHTMKEQGLNLKETLKYIKENNLYKK